MLKKVFVISCFLFAVFSVGHVKAQAVTVDTAILNAAEHFLNILPAGSTVVVLNFQSAHESLSEHMINRFTMYMVNDGRLIVVDRMSFDAILQELDLSMSGHVSDETALSIGRMFGAQTVISGTVTPMPNALNLWTRAIAVETAVVQSIHNTTIAMDAALAALTTAAPLASAQPQVWHDNRFFVGVRAGGGGHPAIFGEGAAGANVHAAVSLTGQITDIFGIQTELLWTFYRTTPYQSTIREHTRVEHRFLLPLLARFTFRHNYFSYGAIAGVYLSIPTGIDARYNNTNQRARWSPSSPAFGIMFGGNFGRRIGPGVFFLDLRAHMDLIEAEYDFRLYGAAGQFIGTGSGPHGWGGFNVSIGYEIGIFGRR